MLETHMKLCVTEPDFPEKFFCPKNCENGTKMGQKQDFFEYIEKFCHYFLLKILVPEIWAKMFPANQIEGFFN